MSKQPAPLPPDALRWQCDETELSFETTDELTDLSEVIGQTRALEALEFGIGMRFDGYNLCAIGSTGVGKHSVVMRILDARAADEAAPNDWVYVQDFDAPERPRALRLPPGHAIQLSRDMDRLVDDLLLAIPSAFDTDEYRTRRREVEAECKAIQQQLIEQVRALAEKEGVAVIHTPSGVALASLRDGQPLTNEEFEALPDDEQRQRRAVIDDIGERLEPELARLPATEKRARERVRELDREVTSYAVSHSFEELRRAWATAPEVTAWFDRAAEAIVEAADRFVVAVDESGEGEDGGPRVRFPEFRVNPLVDHDGAKGAPVVHEDLPTIANLVGRVESGGGYGPPRVDVTLIRPGALHRANGGYLVLDAMRLVERPPAWEQLKRALRAKEIRIPQGDQGGGPSSMPLEPAPIPLEVKVVLVGERELLGALGEADPEFDQLFKVVVDFEETLPRNAANVSAYARWVATLVRQQGLRPFRRCAVTAVLALAARTAEDSERLSLNVGRLVDLLREADWVAERAGHPVVLAPDVDAAVDAARRREGRLRELTLDEIRSGRVLVRTDGVEVGEINGLSVQSIGRAEFGRPSRITARVWLGQEGLLDIEREVMLGGPIHSKGVLILAGFLGARYAAELPLALAASIVFEQSYGGVEGDSASLAETCALLSALSGVPLRQDFGVTGSMDQQGRVQAVGGLNTKIEGFFEVCQARGLTGDQGVIIPASNVGNLMLRTEVVDAAREGRFVVVPVTSVDDAMAMLTGVLAGERDGRGRYPDGSINRRVADRLATLAERAKASGLFG